MVMVILMIALELLRGGGAIKRLYEDSITNLLQPTFWQIKGVFNFNHIMKKAYKHREMRQKHKNTNKL